MSDNKKYYYLKLKDNFYDSEEIKILENMDNGYKYTTLLLKLYLRSLKNEGRLRVNEYIPYDNKMISAVTGMDVDTVRVAMEIFKRLKLVEVLNDGTIYLLNIQNYIGESSTEADRIRSYRNSIAEQKQQLLVSNGDSVQMYNNCTPEIEKKKDIKKEKKIDILDAYTSNPELIQAIKDFREMRTKIKKPLTDKALKMILNKLDELANNDEIKIKILEQSILYSWQGVFAIKENQQQHPKQPQKQPTNQGSKREYSTEELEDMTYNNKKTIVLVDSCTQCVTYRNGKCMIGKTSLECENIRR